MGAPTDRTQRALAPGAHALALDALVLDLLRAGDDAALDGLAREAAPRVADPNVRAALESIARARGPSARATALRALRATASAHGATRPASSSSSSHATPRAATPAAPPSAPSASRPVAASTPGGTSAPRPAPAPTPAPAPEPAASVAWSVVFEEALAAPSTATLAHAALALVDLDGKLPPGVSPAQIKDLASRFAMASIEHEGPTQQNLSRLARGLKSLG